MKKIVKGNDFTLKIPVMKSVEGQKVPFPLPACTDVQVRVCNQFKRISLSYEVDVENDNVILARVEGDQISLGTYAIEVKGKIFGNDWRSNEYPQFAIVANNADADTEFSETDEGDNSVEMDTALVILPPSVELQNLITKAETATDNANTAAGNTNEAIRKCETATAGAEKVNANLTDDNVVEITDRKGTTKSVSLDEAVKVGNDVTRIKQTLGAYSNREDIVLTPKETNKAISSDGVKVAKQGWAIAEFTAEKGNEYLFKPNVIDGSVCVFAEYITSIETRGIDYTYTYNEDGTIATATATYLGNTHTYTYEWTVEAGVNTPTIKEGDTVINNLPMTYETKVGTYSPLVKLNEDAELPVDGYCRYMSHFKGNSSIKIVVSYKVGTADLTMKVLRDGVLASISTQLGNLSQKEDETRKKVEEYHGSYAEFMFNDDTRIIVDGKNIIIAARVKTRVYPKKSLVVGNRYSKKTLIYADVANLDTSGFTTFNAMFANCNMLSELNLSAWDTSQVTSMAYMFSGCSSLTSLNLSAWDTSQVTSMASMFSGCSSLTSLNLSAWDTTSLGKGVKESVNDTGIYMMFFRSYNIKTLDMGGDGWNFVNIPSSNSFYRPLESGALTEWKLGKNFFKGRFVNQYYNNKAFSNWSKSSFIESIVTNSYDRRANGYDDVTLYFAAKLKDYLSEDDIATMTAKGYIIA